MDVGGLLEQPVGVRHRLEFARELRLGPAERQGAVGVGLEDAPLVGALQLVTPVRAREERVGARPEQHPAGAERLFPGDLLDDCRRSHVRASGNRSISLDS